MAANFVVNRELTALALMYKNPDRVLIADKVLPKSSVGTQAFDFTEIPRESMYALPDDTIGPRGEWPSLEIGGVKRSSSTRDRGLSFPVRNDDQNQSVPNQDPRQIATAAVTSWLQLRREKRVADLVFAATTYPVGGKVTLAGANQWSDPTSNPLTAMLSAWDGMLMRPNKLVLGSAVWTALRAHPRLVKAIRGNDSGEGVITREELAQLLEITEVIVGEGWANTAKPGEAVSMARLWGKHALGIYSDSTVTFQTPGVTFGLTAEYGSRVAGVEEKGRMGLRGGVEVYVGESLGETIISTGCAFFWENAVA